MRGIQQHLAEFGTRYVRVVAISVDPPQTSRDWARKQGYTYTFLSDTGAQVIRQYDLLHAGGRVGGKDIARPAEFLVDNSGSVRWRNLTGDFRIRARPEEMLQAIDAAHL